ncbi:Hypothetical protein AJAP_27880 [Amycolatopsis japonica]|uniref:dATP/dGTP diphosphohydrolase N-terminal domain-containing protein n=1 Tax=Amycolatopsis japonica TaxID=208439 RepID=A0A075V687_9PSEU|nr:dATP/dGTP diphosphohydrolase domain-containing protein [Amycolatopsis japonica]AIG78420.1 Hypothetical protein AJAP_27880 [Amycolatopsis japonica]
MRNFTDEAEPPFGERIQMRAADGWPLTWTGKRWHIGLGLADPSLHEAWPPCVPGPYFEITEEEYVTASSFTTKDSGERSEFEGGGQRDSETGKPRFDLLLPVRVPYEDQLLTRVAALMGRGAEKYEDRNWEKFSDQAALDRARSSAFRHFMQWFNGETDEDHAAAVVFNLKAAEYVKGRLAGRW